MLLDIKRTLSLAAAFLMLLALSMLASCSAEESSDSSAGSTDTSSLDLDPQYQEDEDPGYLLDEQEDVVSALDMSEGDSYISGYMPEDSAQAGEPYALMEGAATFPPTDRRYICGEATNVFVGEVTAEVDNTPITVDSDFEDASAQPPLPQTQFTVQPDSTQGQAKGSIGTDPVTINQIGGKVNPEDTLEVLNGDPPLEIGSTYVFAVKWDAANSYYTITMQPYGNLKDPPDAARKIRDFRQACKYEKTADEAHAAVNEAMDAVAQGQYSEEE